MFTKTNAKKSIIVLTVAALLIATVVFTACNGGKPFVPVSMPEQAEAESNGGIVVKYGEWLYYVNGYQSDVAAENTYVQAEPRVGSVVRIKLAVLEDLFAISADKDVSSTNKEKQIAAKVREQAETVVPKIYYSGNSSNTRLNGLFIFNDRLYMMTPNDELTAGGNKLTSQMVLVSFKLDGSDMQRHYTFEKNSAQVMLKEMEGKLYVVSFVDTEVALIDVAAGTKTVIEEKASNANFDIAGQGVFFTNEDGAIKYFTDGTEAKVIVPNEKREDQEKTSVTYTIKSVNNGYVYYTVKDSENSGIDELALYYANAEKHNQVALDTVPDTFYGWNDKVVYVRTFSAEKTLYGLYVTTNVSGADPKEILSPVHNDKAITFNRIEGNKLYYTVNNFAYVIDLSQDKPQAECFARDLAAASGWYYSEVIGSYAFSLSSANISVVKYDAEKLTNSASVKLTLTSEPKEDEE